MTAPDPWAAVKEAGAAAIYAQFVASQGWADLLEAVEREEWWASVEASLYRTAATGALAAMLPLIREQVAREDRERTVTFVQTEQWEDTVRVGGRDVWSSTHGCGQHIAEGIRIGLTLRGES